MASFSLDLATSLYLQPVNMPILAVYIAGGLYSTDQ